MGFYVYILVKLKAVNTQVTKVKKVVKCHTQACSCIVLKFCATSGSPSWFLLLVIQKALEGFLYLLVIYYFG